MRPSVDESHKVHSRTGSATRRRGAIRCAGAGVRERIFRAARRCVQTNHDRLQTQLPDEGAEGAAVIRTHMLPCAIPRAEADALNRESGRVYTETLVWHYRIYRRKGIWLSPGAAERLGDYLSPTTLHAHSRDAAQQAFYKACKTAKANRGMGAKYPHKRKYYRPTIWKNSGIRVQNGAVLLARARGLTPIVVALPPAFQAFGKAAFVEMRLIYDRIARRYQWHLVVDDGVQPPDRAGDQTLAADLG